MTFEVIDTIRNLTDADLALCRSQGITGFSRYIARTSSIGKIMRRDECDRILAGGFNLIVNYEQSAGDWQGGAAQGAADGTWARNYVRNTLGLPDSVCIVQSIDTSVLTAQLRIAADYQRAFNDGGGCGPQGVYGPRNVLEHLAGLGLVRVCWEWMGVKGAASSPVANIRQYRDKPYPLPFSYDVNTPITAYYGQHSATGTGEDIDMTDAQAKQLEAVLQILVKAFSNGEFPGTDPAVVLPASRWLTGANENSHDTKVGVAAVLEKLDGLTFTPPDVVALRTIVREEVDSALADLTLRTAPPS